MKFHKIIQISEQPPRADNELSQIISDIGTASEGR
jgi:hypothetical protein